MSVVNGVNRSFDTSDRVVPSSDPSEGSLVVIQRTHNNNLTCLQVGTWNVRTMNSSGKLKNIKIEMDKTKLDILGLCEVKWKGTRDFVSGKYQMIYSGGDA